MFLWHDDCLLGVFYRVALPQTVLSSDLIIFAHGGFVVKKINCILVQTKKGKLKQFSGVNLRLIVAFFFLFQCSDICHHIDLL